MTAPLHVSTAESVEALTVLIERSGIDITADYGDWCNIGFALAYEFGADGETYFLRISSLYPGYDRAKASKQYAYCLRHKVPSGKAPITIATLFHIAKAHGIDLPCPPSKGVAAGRGIHSCAGVGREPMCSPYSIGEFSADSAEGFRGERASPQPSPDGEGVARLRLIRCLR